MRIILILLILLVFTATYAFWMLKSQGGRQVIVEKRIALLDRAAPFEGILMPSGDKVQKLVRELGGMQRSFMLIKPGETAKFEGLPHHRGSVLDFYVGAERPGPLAFAVDVDLCRADGTEERSIFRIGREITMEKPEWVPCSLKISDEQRGETLRISFSIEKGEANLRVANPVLHSQGRPVRKEDFPTLNLGIEKENLVRTFDRAEKIAGDEEFPPMQTTPNFFDSEKRTRADEEKKIIWAHPDAEFRYKVTVPEGGVLEAAPFVFPVVDVRGGQDPGHVTYTITIDGKKVFSIRSDYINQEQVYFNNPYARLIHRTRIDLSDRAGEEILLGFRTELAAGTEAPKGTGYCWWDLILRQEREITRREASRRFPNVLVLCVDALRADHLACYGYDRATSPYLDALADRSLVFENAMSPCSWTLPATASLLTGLHPNTHGVLGHTRNYLVNGITTLAEYLTWYGVTTAAFSANVLVCSAINFNQGFERFIENDEPAEGVNADLFAWLEECGPFQFFAYVHYMEPHSPYSAPGAYRQHFDPDYEETRSFAGALPEMWRHGKIPREFTDEEFQHLVNLYDSEIHYWDLNFKRLLERLEELGLADKTIIVVTADHGEEFMDHDALGHGLTLYNEVIHVPLVLHDPRMKRGSRIEAHVDTTGLFNTVARLAGFPAPDFTQVKGMLPPAEIPSRFQALYSSTDSNMPKMPERWASVIAWPWKLISEVRGKEDKLFNLEADPKEKQNLLDKHPDESRRLKLQVKDWYERTAEAFPDEMQPPTPDKVKEALQQLGYADGN
ncbi:MAG: sulfatase [Planctomycetota bacterium]|jgi:arylsulfatase A-like enzyme